MTTELEQEFFKVFEIKPKFRYFVQSELPIVGTGHCRPTYDLTKEQFKNFALSRAKGYKLVKVVKIYPEITDRKLLEMICVYNSFQNDEDSLLIPFDINNVKDIALQVITKSVKDKSLNNYYCNDVEKLKTKIQQLFKEEE